MRMVTDIRFVTEMDEESVWEFKECSKEERTERLNEISASNKEFLEHETTDSYEITVITKIVLGEAVLSEGSSN